MKNKILRAAQLSFIDSELRAGEWGSFRSYNNIRRFWNLQHCKLYRLYE